jgi:hypothetical protein
MAKSKSRLRVFGKSSSRNLSFPKRKVCHSLFAPLTRQERSAIPRSAGVLACELWRRLAAIPLTFGRTDLSPQNTKITKRTHPSCQVNIYQSTTCAKTVSNRHQKRTQRVASQPSTFRQSANLLQPLRPGDIAFHRWQRSIGAFLNREAVLDFLLVKFLRFCRLYAQSEIF